jgi:hypothetical protein
MNEEHLPEVMVHIPPMIEWGTGIIAVTLVALAARIEVLHSHMAKALDRQVDVLGTLKNLETMHEHPDDYKFGTSDTNKMVQQIGANCEQVCRRHNQVLIAIERLAQLIAYDIEQRTGKRPPPMPMRSEDRKV